MCQIFMLAKHVPNLFIFINFLILFLFFFREEQVFIVTAQELILDNSYGSV